jgi:hypothetical protein
MKQSKSKIKGIIEAKKKSNRKKNGWAEISYIDKFSGERVTAQKGNLVNFKIGTDIVYRGGVGVQHYGKVVDGGNKTKYMIKFHGSLTELVPRSKVFGWR